MIRLLPIPALVLLGAGWGLTQPLAKIAVSTGYRHFGLVFWQFVLGAIVLGTLLVLLRRPLPLGRDAIRFYVIIAVVGTIAPNSALYESARHLPAGILAIAISWMPILAFPIAIALRVDRFSWIRLAGLAAGLAGVSLLILPETSLPAPGLGPFVLLASMAALMWALEAGIVARWGTFGCDPVQALLGASIAGAVLVAPMALASGQWIGPHWPLDAADRALAASSVVHVLSYAGYIWLVGFAGAVFAAQCSYLVTGFGIGWSMLLLSEAYSAWVWLSLAAMFVGLFLVRPRTGGLEGGPAVADNAARGEGGTHG